MPRPRLFYRGEIYWFDWGGAVGRHPALIIQNDLGNETAHNIIIAYITDAPRPELPLLVHFKTDESSLPNAGCIDLGRIMTVPKTMLTEKIGMMSIRIMLDVNQALKHSLGIP